MKWLFAVVIAVWATAAQCQIGPLSGVIIPPISIGPSTAAPTSNIPSWVLQPNGVAASIDMDFADGLYFGATLANLTTTRTTTNGSATDLLPTSSSGFAYTTFGNNVARITSGLGLLVEEGRTNFLLNSAAPATQTTGSLGTGTYTLWVNGSGSATMSSGTGTGCGTGAASQGTSVSFTITVAGTCIVTVAGSLNAFQLELNPGTVSNPTSLIVTTASTGARGSDNISLTGQIFGAAWSTYVSATPDSPVTYAAAQVALVLNDGTDNNRGANSFRNLTNGLSEFQVTSGGANVYSQAGSAWAVSTQGKLAGSYAVGAQNAAFNGSAFTAGTSSTTTATPTLIAIGSNLVTSQRWMNGYIARVAIWLSTALTSPQLVTITNGSGP